MSEAPDDSLVERLRRKDDFAVFVAPDGMRAIRVMTEAERRGEAAAEIEKLRGALKEITEGAYTDEERIEIAASVMEATEDE